MDSFSKCVFVRAGKHTSVHDVHPHSKSILMIVSGMLVSSNFLISVCMFIVSKALLISSVTLIVRAGGAIWMNPFATVLFTVCTSVPAEWCVFTCVAWVRLVCLLLCKVEGSSPVSLQLLRGGIWACMRCPCLCLCWVLGWGLC